MDWQAIVWIILSGAVCGGIGYEMGKQRAERDQREGHRDLKMLKRRKTSAKSRPSARALDYLPSIQRHVGWSIQTTPISMPRSDDLRS